MADTMKFSQLSEISRAQMAGSDYAVGYKANGDNKKWTFENQADFLLNDSEAGQEFQETFVKVQDTEPTDENNKIWIEETPENEVEVPTYDEFEDVVEDVENLKSAINDNAEFLGFSTNAITSIIQGYYNNDGELNTNNNYSHSNMIDVSNANSVYIAGTGMTAQTTTPAVGVFLDSNDVLVATIYDIVAPSSPPWLITVPKNATKLYINTTYKKSDYPNSVPTGFVCYKIAKEIMFLSDITGGKRVKILAGVIRNTGTGWYFIHNDTHDDLNFASITIDDNNRIVLNYGFTAKKVLALCVTPDETFANKYYVGASVAVSNATLRIYTVPKFIGGMVQYNGTIWQTNYANFTNYSFNTSTGVLTMTHETVANYPTNSKLIANATGRKCNVQLGTLSDTSMSLYFLDSDGNVKTTPDTDMRAYVSRNLPSVEMDANDVSAPDGNFWVFGIMEV